MASSNLAAISLPRSWEIRKMNTPFHAGHTGSLAYFSMFDTVLIVLSLSLIVSCVGDICFVDDNVVLIKVR